MDSTKWFRQVVILSMMMLLIGYNVYPGLILQELCIPSVACVKVGFGKTPPTPAQPSTQSPAPETPSKPSSDGTKANDASQCIITIASSLVSLMSEPNGFSQQLIQVRSGNYGVLEAIVVKFGPMHQSWLKIEAEGRQGWIANDTWTIAAKSSACP